MFKNKEFTGEKFESRFGHLVCEECGRPFRKHSGLYCRTVKVKTTETDMLAVSEMNKVKTTETDMLAVSEMNKAMDVQVGGGHYKDLVIQPVEYIHKNHIGFIEGSVIKYVTRWRAKGGLEDLKKARHFIDLLIEMEQQGIE